MIKKSNEFESENLRANYMQKISGYERLAINLQQALKGFLEEANISYLDVTFRTKEFSSFEEKIQRKSYENPFDDCEDFCGIRVICYYPTDVEKICDIIRQEFQVHWSEDKAATLNVQEFGYRSTHFIVTVNPKWLVAPNYRGLDNLKAEIQVRTVLMHAWAEVEHKLAYKKQDQVPNEFKRKLSRLSAKFEEADEQFEELRVGLREYREKLANDAKAAGKFDESLPLNLDTLRAFLDFSFPYLPESNLETLRRTLEDCKTLNIETKDLIEYVDKFSDLLPEIAQQIKFYNRRKGFGDGSINRPGALTWILLMANSDALEHYDKKLSNSISSIIFDIASDVMKKADQRRTSHRTPAKKSRKAVE